MKTPDCGQVGTARLLSFCCAQRMKVYGKTTRFGTGYARKDAQGKARCLYANGVASHSPGLAAKGLPEAAYPGENHRCDSTPKVLRHSIVG